MFDDLESHLDRKLVWLSGLTGLMALMFITPSVSPSASYAVKTAPNLQTQQTLAESDSPSRYDKATSRSPTIDDAIGFMLIFIGGLIAVFLWEPIPLFVIAIGVPVFLVIFQPYTGIGPDNATSGFSSPATITVMAMFILSEGIKRSGLIQVLGDRLSQFTQGSSIRQLGAISFISGPLSGLINNTPVVAIFIPMLSNLAQRVKTSPSKLMMPLSYASMMGGTLTLIGSSSNLLASDLSADLIGHPITFFEFFPIGLVVLITGSIYLIFVGHRLLPERVNVKEDLTSEYEMGEFLTELSIHEDFDYIRSNVNKMMEGMEPNFDLVQIIRDDEQFMEPLQVKTLRPEDRLLIRTNRENLIRFLGMNGVQIFSHDRISEQQIEETQKGQTVVQVSIPRGSFLEGQTLRDVNFGERYDASVLAVRRGGELTHQDMEDIEITSGDVLLLLTTESTLNRLRQNRNFIVAEAIEPSGFRQDKTILSVSILVGVITLASSGLLPIAISALGGAILMVLTGCVRPNELHESVDWEVIFLLAGLIPLGTAMQETGTAGYLANWFLELTVMLPPLGALMLFYLFTAVMTNLVHKNASIVLMIPVAVSASQTLGLQPFPFLITVMFAASTAFLTPIGNHTNLMVYGPGGYRFSDFFKVGAPLQILLAIVTPVAISLFWPLT